MRNELNSFPRISRMITFAVLLFIPFLFNAIVEEWCRILRLCSIDG